MPKTSPRSEDLREHERFAIGAEAKCYEFCGRDGGTPRPFACTVVDISRGGVGVMTRGFMHTGRHVVIVVEINEQKRTFFSEVRHCRLHPSGAHVVGLRFSPEPTDQATILWMRQVETIAGVTPSA